MPLPDELSLRAADLTDLPSILDLRRQVGWAAHEWALRLAIAPAKAHCLVVETPGGELVGVGSGVAYPPLGLVGNMIVSEGHRRQGVGGAILQAVVDFLQEMGCTRLELFATEQGAPLYAAHGFDRIEPGTLARLPRTLPLTNPDGLTVSVADEIALGAAGYDRPRFGGDRSALLASMLADSQRPTLVATRGAEIAGYGWLRSDGDRIGPWVADDPEAASAILAAAFRTLPDREELTSNIPMSNHPGVHWLRSLGVEPDPWDGRMARGPAIPRREETIYGNVVGALG